MRRRCCWRKKVSAKIGVKAKSVEARSLARRRVVLEASCLNCAHGNERLAEARKSQQGGRGVSRGRIIGAGLGSTGLSLQGQGEHQGEDRKDQGDGQKAAAHAVLVRGLGFGLGTGRGANPDPTPSPNLDEIKYHAAPSRRCAAGDHGREEGVTMPGVQ